MMGVSECILVGCQLVYDSSMSVNIFLHVGQGFPHELPVLENVILHPPCKTSRVR